MLANKLGITDPHELSLIEERITKSQAMRIIDESLLLNHPAGTFSTLKFIHTILFQDIYDFAGKIRTINISKNDYRFASALYLPEAVHAIEAMPHTTLREIVDKYAEMNVAHPFREGNGRSMRIWLDHLLSHEQGLVVQWHLINSEEYLSAIRRSPLNTLELYDLVQRHTTPNRGDRTLFARGINASYAYEGYTRFDANDL